MQRRRLIACHHTQRTAFWDVGPGPRQQIIMKSIRKQESEPPRHNQTKVQGFVEYLKTLNTLMKHSTQTQSSKGSRLMQIIENAHKSYEIHHQRQSVKSSRLPNKSTNCCKTDGIQTIRPVSCRARPARTHLA